MSGGVFLAGGGSPRQEQRVWQAAFEGVARVVYWPFALPDALSFPRFCGELVTWRQRVPASR